MYSRQLEQIASRRQRELAGAIRPRHGIRASRPRRPIRSHTGWALVALGLRLAASGSR